jgi:PAS domain S-box-containing protein
MKAGGGGKIESILKGAESWQGELVRFIVIAVLGAAASYLSVNIPHTEVFIEGRWIFGYMGFALLKRWWTALLLACFLSITGPHKLPLSTVLVGNMLYAFPFLLVIRTLHNRVLDRCRTVIGYGLAWLLIILLGYQIFTTPAVWGFLAFLNDSSVWAGIMDGWREQPFLIESLLVGIISALTMMVLRSNAALRASQRELSTTLYSIGDGVIATDADGRIQLVNPAAERLTGWNAAQAIGQPLRVVFDIINEETRRPVESPVTRVLNEGTVVGLANHTLLVSKDGQKIPIADSGAPMFDPSGNVSGVVLVFRDQTEERLNRRLMQVRLALIEYAASHTLDELLTHVLDEVGGFVDSSLGFYHLLESDQTTLSLQRWSTQTLQEFCQIEGQAMHPDVDQAGVWADCVHEKKPVIQNNYASLPHKKGVPDGHVEITRELVVPVIRGDKVVAILAVGNKPTEYTHRDAEVVSYLADVTWEIVQQKRAESQREAALREQERLNSQMCDQTKQIEQILETVPAGVLLLDAKGRVLQANPLAEKILTVLADSGTGDVLEHLGDRSLAELLTSPPTKGLWHKVKADKLTFEVIARPTVSATNSTKESDQSLSEDSKGSPGRRSPDPEHWVLVINDVTQEQEVRKQLEQQERLAAVGQLAAGIAHDFNNIMSTIILYARMIEQAEGLSDRDRQRLNVINQQAWHATQLIDQILDFSRRAVLERRPLDLLPLLKEQVKLLKRTLPEHIEIVLAYGQDEYTVHADPTRMQQVLTNLAVNARDAMPNGGTFSIELERVTTETEEWIRLTASDTGTGIAPDVLPHIFEPFFTTKEPGQGSGLGLAQVHGIVGLHGGHIDVTTEVGQGTTFTIDLPALTVRPTEPLPPDVSALPRGRGETILVVEDEDALRTALVESLKRLNYQTLEATNGQEALTVLAERGAQVALVVSDVVMPKMGGVALFHTLREQERLQNWQTPVILLTGHPMHKELDELRAQGLSAWLTKPPEFKHLAQAIDEALRK